MSPARRRADMNSPQANNILAALPGAELDKFASKLRPFKLELGEILYSPDDKIEHVFFPTSGVISLLAAFEDGSTVEAGIIGNEGILGTPVVLGADFTPHQALVQADGDALKMTASDLRVALQNDGLLLAVLLRFTNSLFTQVAQTAGCNRAHTLE